MFSRANEVEREEEELLKNSALVYDEDSYEIHSKNYQENRNHRRSNSRSSLKSSHLSSGFKFNTRSSGSVYFFSLLIHSGKKS